MEKLLVELFDTFTMNSRGKICEVSVVHILILMSIRAHFNMETTGPVRIYDVHLKAWEVVQFGRMYRPLPWLLSGLTDYSKLLSNCTAVSIILKAYYELQII